MDKQQEEKKRILQLGKQIALTESAIINTQGYAKIIETEGHLKALTKEIKEQMDKNLSL